MDDVTLSIADFQALIQPLIGINISLTWKGFGSSIFLELGQLSPLGTLRRYHRQGEACIHLEWQWRVEFGAIILYGSSNSRPQIESNIGALQGTTILSIIVAGKIPELIVQFSNGHCLRSLMMATGDPEWSVRIPDGRSIYAKDGSLLIGTGGSTMTKEEEEVVALEKLAAARWGIPSAEPKQGSCIDCAAFVCLDGHSYLLDYGVCCANEGPFDGRVVERNSGCPLFKSTEDIS